MLCSFLMLSAHLESIQGLNGEGLDQVLRSQLTAYCMSVCKECYHILHYSLDLPLTAMTYIPIYNSQGLFSWIASMSLAIASNGFSKCPMGTLIRSCE
jgi:hypothetical protein